MEECLVILSPFQQYFSHIRTTEGNNERLCARESHVRLKRFPLPAGLTPGLLDQRASD